MIPRAKSNSIMKHLVILWIHKSFCNIVGAAKNSHIEDE